MNLELSQRGKMIERLHFGQNINVFKVDEKRSMIGTQTEAVKNSYTLWASMVGKGA